MTGQSGAWRRSSSVAARLSLLRIRAILTKYETGTQSDYEGQILLAGVKLPQPLPPQLPLGIGAIEGRLLPAELTILITKCVKVLRLQLPY